MSCNFSFATLILSTLAILCTGGCTPVVFTKLPQESIKSSSEFELKGDLTAAVERLKIALAIDPGNIKAEEELKRLTVKRDIEAEKHYQAGQTLKGSDPEGARKEFLAAIRIRSDYMDAVRALKDLQLESSEATLHARARKEAASRTQPKYQESLDEILEETRLENAIELYDEGNYTSAIQELQKAKSHTPNDPEIKKYLNLSWYNYGISLFKKKEFRKALDAFSMLKKNFEDVDKYIQKCQQALKKEADDLYKIGMKYFREQKLQEAISKWNAVLSINPDHIKAKEYIIKAKKLLNALKERR
jgi:tetratricopeptide (TPR) repeat protein